MNPDERVAWVEALTAYKVSRRRADELAKRVRVDGYETACRAVDAGMTERQVADALGVSTRTIFNKLHYRRVVRSRS